ncbi:N-acetylneuraminate (7)9-O-acetyltransferase isoform X3 [Haemaphysalis longicornis]
MVEEARHINASSEFIHHINAKNCKIVACFVVAGFVAYHGVVHLTYGIDTCKWLLSDGRFQGYHVWQPYGCMLHTYTNAESRMCLRYIAYWGGQNHIVFMGDSRIRQLYWALVHQVQQPGGAAAEGQQAHRDLRFEEKDLRLTVAVQILTNAYCNDHMNYNDGTCCSSPEPVTWLQAATFAAFGVAWALCAVRWLRRRWLAGGGGGSAAGPAGPSALALVSRLGLVMGYFFVCDRTTFFLKENKSYTHLSFFLPVGYLFALGLFFTEEAGGAGVLRREQTDEWKGWMQLVLLAYHVTGASQVLPVYVHVRALVSAYLFLAGYGHFCYFWREADWGLLRLARVLFRTNLLVVLLCLCMNRPYQFYYFVPLVSFWFLVLAATLASPPRVAQASAEANPLHHLYLVAKLVALFALLTVLYLSEVFFERIFVTRPWKALFVTTDDSIKEWWFRWKIDRYSVATGMLFGFGHYLLRQYRVLGDTHHGNLFSRGLSLSLALGALLGLGFYTTFAFVCRSKPDCNEVHAYIFFVPILSYIILRNMSGLLRARYSTFFAWFGKISLELFIAQYHIWLAADTHGVLVLVPGYPVLNVMVTSLVMVCVAHEVHALTARLTPLAVPADWKYLVRNLALFGLLLVPIGVHDGMF